MIIGIVPRAAAEGVRRVAYDKRWHSGLEHLGKAGIAADYGKWLRKLVCVTSGFVVKKPTG